MDALSIIEQLEEIEDEIDSDLENKIVYVAENGEHTCQECGDNDGKVFDIDDPDLPLLPVHPHCHCKYVSATDEHEDISGKVEKYRIVKALKENTALTDEDAKSLAGQIVDARRKNPNLQERRLFMLFNGRHFVSSDGKLLLDAISGHFVSEREYIDKVTAWGYVRKTIEREFDYSYARQGVSNEGGIPRGLYYIEAREERSIKTSPWHHGVKTGSWGDYSWTIHPAPGTDVRGRSGFFVHGGAEFNTRGCIDLQGGVAKFRDYFVSTGLSYIYIYVEYEKERVKIRENTGEFKDLTSPVWL